MKISDLIRLDTVQFPTTYADVTITIICSK